MLKKRELAKNISMAFMAQGFAMVVSVAQTLIVPKILGVEQFAYWQLFIFYIGYVGFFHLGLCSGVYLKMGGKTRREFDKASAKSQFLIGLIYQSVMAAIIIASGLLFEDGPRSFVFIQTAIYLILANACTYLMNIMQCMNEIRESSISLTLGKVSYFLPLILMILSGVRSFEPYVIAYTGSMIVQIIYCFWKLRDFIAAPWLGFGAAVKESYSSIRVGINLMVANIASTLILGIARFIIDDIWGIEAFGKLSLMFSIVSFSLLFVNQASIALFPALRKCDESESASFYINIRAFLGLALPLVYILYYPVKSLFSLWLPEYSDALPYLALLLPICVFDSVMSITGNTYLQVFRKEKMLRNINIAASLVSIVLCVIGGYFCQSITAVLLGPTLAIASRSIFTEFILSRKMHTSQNKYVLWMALLTILFIVFEVWLEDSLALVATSVSYLIYLAIHAGHLRRVLGSMNRVAD